MTPRRELWSGGPTLEEYIARYDALSPQEKEKFQQDMVNATKRLGQKNINDIMDFLGDAPPLN